jgi:hypothetical protein
MVAKRLAREHELVEFRPLPGQEDEWAAGSEWETRSLLWKWLGLYPLLAYVAIMFALLGMS